MTTAKIKTLVVDDHKMIRDGLSLMLESNIQKLDFQIDQAESGMEGIKCIQNAHYDIVIMDYQMPGMDGAETTAAMLEHKPNLKVLILSNYDESVYIDNTLNAGAMGYVLKHISSEEMIKAISSVLKGKKYYSNEIAVKLLNPDKQKLSERQMQILRLVAAENTSQEIAKRLFLSIKTVERHREDIFKKLEVNNMIGLLKKAKLLKLID